MPQNRIWFLVGLFLTTLSTLTLEILDTRLLSVLTWYHLSFFAVSIAMFGMAAGAVTVYLGGTRFEGEQAVRSLGRYGTIFALTIAFSHLANICIPIPIQDRSPTAFVALALSTVVLALPFYFSGVLVAIALTRIRGRIGLIYAFDLLGASLGGVLVLPLLTFGNITSAAFVCSALAAAGAACFRRFGGAPLIRTDAALFAVFLILAGYNSSSSFALRLLYTKGNLQYSKEITHESWSIHGLVLARSPKIGAPGMWGPGIGARDYEVERIAMKIDGGAGTGMTRWNGDRAVLQWTEHDVTSIPYHIRRGGDVAVVGVGGGRDILTALWADSRSVVGIEINRAFIELLEGPLRSFANLASHPRVRLVHDEGRSYLTRTQDRYDILQMSLIDTWAATGAGAFTLSENGLYTLEAWDVFLRTLKPDGVLSVSRWYSPDKASETSRLVALGTASLLRNGVSQPSAHLVLVSRGHVATLMISKAPFSSSDLETLSATSTRFGFKFLLGPSIESADPLLGRIVASLSLDEVLRAVADESYDYTPPTDARPYFFNIVKPAGMLTHWAAFGRGGVIGGNLLATLTLGALLAIVMILVGAVILGPLFRSGLPSLSGSSFALAVLYFALIGAGYMLIQIGFMQRFSVYLGHPTYAVAVVLSSMILATGAGSLISDRLPLENPFWVWATPLAAALVLGVVSWAIQIVVESTIQFELLPRCGMVLLLVAPVSFLLGLFFPVGMRLVERLSNDAMPWMWGVNGAWGVLASVIAVAISMWSGINTSLYVAIGAYALLALPATALWSRGTASE
jgi:SAM-dependent methyltransferase